jgi:hypothetical protein
MSAGIEREVAERAAREDLLQAETEYRDAVALSRFIADDIRELPCGHPDAEVARQRAADREASARERYQIALKDFSEVILYGRRPAFMRE